MSNSSAALSIRRIATYQQYSASLVVLSDTARQSALPLQEALIRESIKRGLRIVAVCTERLFSADIMCSPNIATIDWRTSTTTPRPTAAARTVADRFKGLAQEIGRRIDTKSEGRTIEIRRANDVLVVFDSLEPMLQSSVSDTLVLLRNVRHKLDLSSKSRILARFPRDVFTRNNKVSVPADSSCYIASDLCELADATIDVYSLSSLDTWMPGWYSNDQQQPFLSLRDCDNRRGVLRLEHKRQSGKVCFEVATFEISDQLLPEFSPVNSSPSASSIGPLSGPEVRTAGNTTEPTLTARPPQPSSQSTDPTANLSFNLNLTDKQRRDKAGVALPYLEARVADVSGGEIIYQLDDEDDWDEDDPDDDLEI
ncbi:Elongator complex protein [Coemansia sp. S2]|nr:Elongator complex protein [Coemansia sp. S3946]KAJ2044294.1 Elongator complex protein [Coemansia sp. S2]KAJ2334583.1 Elongator complex protein [Coemansia sp. RSA 2673]